MLAEDAASRRSRSINASGHSRSIRTAAQLSTPISVPSTMRGIAGKDRVPFAAIWRLSSSASGGSGRSEDTTATWPAPTPGRTPTETCATRATRERLDTVAGPRVGDLDASALPVLLGQHDAIDVQVGADQGQRMIDMRVGGRQGRVTGEHVGHQPLEAQLSGQRLLGLEALAPVRQQDDDEPRLEREQDDRGHDVAAVGLPERRLIEQERAARRQPSGSRPQRRSCRASNLKTFVSSSTGGSRCAAKHPGRQLGRALPLPLEADEVAADDAMAKAGVGQRIHGHARGGAEARGGLRREEPPPGGIGLERAEQHHAPARDAARRSMTVSIARSSR